MSLFPPSFITHLYADETTTHHVIRCVYNCVEIVATVFICSAPRKVSLPSSSQPKVKMETQATFSSELPPREIDPTGLPSANPHLGSTAYPQLSSTMPLTIKGITHHLTLEQYQRLAHKITAFQQIEKEESLVRQQIQRLHQEKLRLRTLLDDLSSTDNGDESSDYGSS